MSHAPAHLHRLVNESSLPGCLAAVVEADLAVGIPARVANPTAQILRHPRHRVGVALRAGFLEPPDLGFERLAERFVGVQRQDPVVRCLFGAWFFWLA